MSAHNSEKPPLTVRFANAVGVFFDRHEEWFSKHPKADAALAMAFMGAVIGYNILRTPDRAIRNAWLWARTPLEAFEPSHQGFGREMQQPPYWQDLVFGEGRLEKLLARLDGQPHVKTAVQKMCLADSMGGLRVLPGHRDLVKYGLNDLEIIHVMRHVSHLVGGYVEHGDCRDSVATKAPSDENVSLIMDGTGIHTLDDNKATLLSHGGAGQSIYMNLQNLIDVYRASGCNDAQASVNSDKTAQAVYNWILHDVLPVVPHLFIADYSGGYTATQQPDGSLRLDRLPEDYNLKDPAYGDGDFLKRRSRENCKGFYEIMADGYRGTLPDYNTALQPQKPLGPGPA